MYHEFCYAIHLLSLAHKKMYKAFTDFTRRDIAMLLSQRIPRLEKMPAEAKTECINNVHSLAGATFD